MRSAVVSGERATVHLAYARSDEVRPWPGHPLDLEAAARLAPPRPEEFLGARALLRRLLQQVRGDLAGLPLDRQPRGRPFLRGAPADFGISLSHDRDHLAVAAADVATVGVDVQQPLEAADDLLLRRCLAAHVDDVMHLPPDDRRRIQAEVWTVQEACVKAEGTGLSGNPWSIDVAPGAACGRWRSYAWRTLPDWPVPAAVAWGEPML